MNIYRGKETGIISPLYLCLRVDDIQPDFLNCYFKGSAWYKFIYENGDSGVRYDRVSIKDEMFLSLPISHPASQKEQAKIANFLLLLDRRISTQRKIIEDYKTVFSTAVAWSYNNCDWDEHRYGDLLKPYIIRNDRQDDYPILSASQSFGMIERDKLNIDIHAEDKSVQTYKMVCPGDYVLHLRSFQGGLAFSENRGICSPAYTIFRPTELLEYGFLREFFMSQTFIKSLRLVTYGIRDGRSINVDEFLDMKIRIPKLEEQKAIAKRLYTLRTKINIEESILMAFEKERQYLLSKMFI